MVDKPTVPIVIFLMGPTAVGKSTVAEHLFESLDAELISVDSGQIYRGMDIGTAKPDQELLQRVPHHLIDIREITESYSVAKFRDDALTLIEKIIAKGKTPLLVGGTMFYFSVLENGISKLPGGDPEVRSEIEQIVQEKGLLYLHQKLTEVDPISAKRIKTQIHNDQKSIRNIHNYRKSVIAESCPQNLRIHNDSKEHTKYSQLQDSLRHR